MTGTLVRANRVAVKANGENMVANFYRTHKMLTTIKSEDTGWNPPDGQVNKSMIRELFRAWIIEHAEEYGIEYDATDRRSAENIRRPRYESDDVLIKDAMNMILPEMKILADKCATKYPIEWAGVQHDEIIPMTTTTSGKDLSKMGIKDGKYEKSGNWAWAVVKFTVTVKFKGEECYIPVQMQLVSGQLKKTGMGIIDFTAKVKAEIIQNGLATEEELDPPKSKESKANKGTDKQDAKANKVEDTKTEEPKVEETPEQETAKTEQPKPKRQRKSKKNTENADKAE